MSFDPPLTLSTDEEVGLVVEVDPVAWFTQADGTVTDLSLYDFEETGDVVDLAKMAEGFTKIELDG